MANKKTDLAELSVRQLRARRRRLARALADPETTLRGTLLDQRRRCGKPGCRCAGGQLHGPYTYLSVGPPAGQARLLYLPAALAGAVRRPVQPPEADLAARLGWAAAGIEGIDTDLGLPGQLTEGRAGFKEVVGRVCLGEAGAIFGLEVSRLARSSADLAKLLELARLTDTLVIDADGVYDLSDINDRMLLGLKNQMAEVDLHILGSPMANPNPPPPPPPHL